MAALMESFLGNVCLWVLCELSEVLVVDLVVKESSPCHGPSVSVPDGWILKAVPYSYLDIVQEMTGQYFSVGYALIMDHSGQSAQTSEESPITTGVDMSHCRRVCLLQHGMLKRIATGCPPPAKISEWRTSRTAPTPCQVDTARSAVEYRPHCQDVLGSRSLPACPRGDLCGIARVAADHTMVTLRHGLICCVACDFGHHTRPVPLTPRACLSLSPCQE